MVRQTATKLEAFPRLRSRLLLPLGWLGGVGLLGAGASLAQAAETPQLNSPPASISTSVAPQPAPLNRPAPVSSPEVVPVVPPVSAAPAAIAPEPGPVVVLSPAANPTPKLSIVSPQAETPNSYDGPSTIVFSARSSGCEYVLQRGQTLNSELCGERPAPKVANAAGDRVAPIQVGPLSLSGSGVSWQGNPDPVTQKFYNQSQRPSGRPGNNNLQLLFPLAIPAPITSLFGWREHPLFGDRRFHSGTDLGAPLGTPVLAAYAGRVVLADFLGGYGLTIALEHKDGTQQTLYAHLSEIFVQPGEWIKQGSAIGRVGSTGNSTGPHLHFEVRQKTGDGWVAVDPGEQLEYALAQLVKALQVAQAQTSKG